MSRARPDPDGPVPARLRSGLDEFLTAMRVEAGLARATLRSYGGDLEHFLRWAARRGIERYEALDDAAVVDYLAERRRSGAAEATVARNLVSLRMLLRFLLAEGAIAADPTALIPAPVLRRSLPHALTPPEVEALLTAIDGEGWRDLRDRALLEVLYACGARIAEALSLRTDDLEPKLRVLRLHGKGDKMRLVPMGARAREALQAWLERGRPEVARDRRPEVFLSRSGRRLDRVNAWRRVKLAALKAGLDVEVGPHTLRHSFASHLIEGGAGLRAVQEMLGHASICTTEVYTHLDAQHVRGIHRLYHPRG